MSPRSISTAAQHNEEERGEDIGAAPADEYSSLSPQPQHEHAVISAFDLFSIGGTLLLISIWP